MVEVGEVGVWWQKTKFTKKHSKMLVIQITAMSYQNASHTNNSYVISKC